MTLTDVGLSDGSAAIVIDEHFRLTEAFVHRVEVHHEAGVLDARNVVDNLADVIDFTFGLDALLVWENHLHWVVGSRRHRLSASRNPVHRRV